MLRRIFSNRQAISMRALLNKIRILWLSAFSRRGWVACGLRYPVTTIGGEVIDEGDFVMRRWSGITWEYREPTPDEASDASWWWATR